MLPFDGPLPTAIGPHSTCFVQIGPGGACLDLLAPDWSPVTLEDIAWSLARLPRFVGHTHGAWAFSVAEHCCYVAASVMGTTGRRDLAAAALLHDAHECATGDIPTPVKAALGRDAVKRLEDRLAAALAARFDVGAVLMQHPAVLRADLEALATERRDLMAPPHWAWGEALPPPWPERIVPSAPGVARERFLSMAATVGVW